MVGAMKSSSFRIKRPSQSINTRIYIRNPRYPRSVCKYREMYRQGDVIVCDELETQGDSVLGEGARGESNRTQRSFVYLTLDKYWQRANILDHVSAAARYETEKTEVLLTALLVLMSMLFLRCSKTFSRLPALAARRNEVFPSDCKRKETRQKDGVSTRRQRDDVNV